MTEHESLSLAKWYVEKAKEVLRAFDDGSYVADEAYEVLVSVGRLLTEGLEIVEPKGLMAPPRS